MNESSVRTEHLPGGPDLERIMREHAYRGAYLQLTVRGALVLFIALTLIFVPPMNDAGWCFAILGAYALWSAAVALWIRKGGTGPVTMIWLGLFVDLAVLATLTLLTGLAAEQSWTADILSNGLFVIPVLACTQLRTDVCVGVVACTIGVFFVSSWATMTSNSEPWPSILLSTMALAGVGAGAIGLTRIQRSRVLTIGQLVGHRTSLLAELMGLEQRERTELSEQLHDGALQYVLAARMDLDELADSAEPVALARAGKALGEATTLLRSSVSELHPTVLVHVGLARAIGDLARSAQGRGGVVVDVDTSAGTTIYARLPTRSCSAPPESFWQRRQTCRRAERPDRACTTGPPCGARGLGRRSGDQRRSDCRTTGCRAHRTALARTASGCRGWLVLGRTG